MCNSRHHFATAAGEKFGENDIHSGSSNFGKGITIEEKERGTAMTLPQKFYCFGERIDFGLFLPPFGFNRCIAL
jgi:hypothetical protein